MLFERMKDLLDKWEPHREALCQAIECTNGTHTEDDVLVMILKGELTLWSSDKSACVTEINLFPQMKVLNVFIGGGDLQDLRDREEKELVPFAKQNGCGRITGCGRPGWTKTLPGYQPGGYFMYKDL